MVAAVEVLCPAFAADAALPTEVKVDVAEGTVDVAGKRIVDPLPASTEVLLLQNLNLLLAHYFSLKVAGK